MRATLGDVSDATFIEIRLRDQEVRLHTPGFESVLVRCPSVAAKALVPQLLRAARAREHLRLRQ
jgi:hypothetical protein